LGRIRKLTDDEQKKFIILGNGLDKSLFELQEPVERVRNKFIYCSDPNRGLGVGLEVIQRLHAIASDVTYEIYYSKLNDELAKKVESMPYVKMNGKVSQKDLIRELHKCEYLMYPSFFFETYCMVALECQMAGVVPIVNKFGALIDTVGDRGLVLESSDKTIKGLIDTMVIETLKLMDDPARKQMYVDKGKKWAVEQEYSLIVEKWINLIEN
jgi:glycosyltransferase involved in cell wall biosynthesis